MPAAQWNRAEGVALHDVCFDGERSSLELIEQAEGTRVAGSIRCLEDE